MGELAGSATVALASLPRVAHTTGSAGGGIAVAEFTGVTTIAIAGALESVAHTGGTSGRGEVGVGIGVLAVAELAGVTTVAHTVVLKLEAHAGGLAGTGGGRKASLAVAEAAGVTVGALTLLEGKAHSGAASHTRSGDLTRLMSEAALLATGALATLESITDTGSAGGRGLTGQIVRELARRTTVAVTLLK